MPLRLRPLPSPARLRGRGSDWLVAIYALPWPGLASPQAYRLSCLPASPSRRPAFPKGFFRALPSPESSFPLSCQGGRSTVRTPCPFHLPLQFFSLLPYSPAKPQTAGECHSSPQRSGRYEDLGARVLPQAPSTGEDRSYAPAEICLPTSPSPIVAAPGREPSCTFMKPMPPMIWMHSSVTFQAAS